MRRQRTGEIHKYMPPYTGMHRLPTVWK